MHKPGPLDEPNDSVVSQRSVTLQQSGNGYFEAHSVVEVTTQVDPEAQASHKRSQEALDNEQRRLRENRNHLLGITMFGALFVFGLIVVGTLLVYMGAIISSQSASPEDKKWAFGFFGSIAGGLVSATVTLAIALLSRRST